MLSRTLEKNENLMINQAFIIYFSEVWKVKEKLNVLSENHMYLFFSLASLTSSMMGHDGDSYWSY